MREVMRELESMGTAQNRKIYQRHGAGEVLFGVSFANLKKLKRKVVSAEGKKGVNHELSLALWNTGNADAQTFATLIAEPAKLNVETLESWVEGLRYYLLADLIGDVAAQSPASMQLLKNWTSSKIEFKKRTGYALLNYLAREDMHLADSFFEPYIKVIERELQASDNRAKEGMNNCLIAIGGRSASLKDQVLQAAKSIGVVEIDHGETSCKTFVIEAYVNKIWDRKKLRSK